MTQRSVIPAVALVVMTTLLVLVVGLYSMTRNISSQSSESAKTIAALRDSLSALQVAVNTLRDQAPGLGEYMSTFQLHMGKLWFATQASNWDLAQYELGELTETMVAAEVLHAIKNNVNTASVLQSVRGTQIPLLQKALGERSQRKFYDAYNQTLQTCNSCHRSVGFGFIHIIKPLSAPVTNQSWNAIQ